ncbi:hypothetical protein GYH30_042942 [Glycine max]|nr:hypothetical protein GYH30_042942 [Glycine max]
MKGKTIIALRSLLSLGLSRFTSIKLQINCSVDPDFYI